MSASAVTDQDDWIVRRPVGKKRTRRDVASLGARNCGTLGSRLAPSLPAVLKITPFDLGEYLASAIVKRADRAALDFVHVKTGAGELCESICPIGERQLTLAPTEDAVNKDHLARFQVQSHCQPSRRPVLPSRGKQKLR